MMKRGASEIIGWVLLVGLSVMLAIMVIAWSKQLTQKTTESIINDVERDSRCADVALKAFVEVQPCQTVNISNPGYFKIAKISARHRFGTKEFDVDLMPQRDSKVLNINAADGIEKVELIPVVNINKKFIGCVDRKYVVACS